MDYVALVFRWMHILAAIAAVGGAFFIRMALLPAMANVPDSARDAFHEAVRSRWARVVAGAVLFLLVSGFYNFFATYRLFKAEAGGLTPLYNAVFGIKFLLALAVFFLSSLLAGRSAAAQKLRRNARFWVTLNLVLAVTLVCLSGVLRLSHNMPNPVMSDPVAAEQADG